MENYSLYNERFLQKKVHNLISNPSIIRNTVAGKRIQILSPGVHNNLEGPDFLDLAVMIDSQIIIGDAEYHKNSSDWNKHKHSLDERYKKVILHIVSNNDLDVNNQFHTLLISNEELNEFDKKHNLINNYTSSDDSSEIEALHQYSLSRILRKTAEIKKILNNDEFQNATLIILKNFFSRYLSLRRRPKYNAEFLDNFLSNWQNTKFYSFLLSINSIECSEIPDKLVALLKDSSSGIGASLRREIVLNCIFPISLAQSGEEARINLFLWYWSTPSIGSYGILKKKFPHISQNFLWQQQGMLEYNRMFGSKKDTNSDNTSDYLLNYSLGEILDFYQIGQNPYIKEK